MKIKPKRSESEPKALNIIQREEFGFRRTQCSCEKCQVWCQHQPGYLVPSDLTRLIPEGSDPFHWAEQNLRASQGFKVITPFGGIWIPSLVPAKQENGHCHWYQEGRCSVHEVSPFGCAFLDQHLTQRQADQRSKVGRVARSEAFQTDSLYAQIWEHLSKKGLVYASSTKDFSNVLASFRKITSREQQHQRQSERRRKKKLRKQKKRSRR